MPEELNYTGFLLRWKDYLSDRSRLLLFISSLIYLIFILIVLPVFLEFIENRSGVVLNDPFLNLFEPVDLTWYTFILIYFSLASALIIFAYRPILFHTALLSYAIVASFRILSMYSLPLEAPSAIILLNDPFVQFFGSGQILTKDLFFSGHTSTLFLIYLISPKGILKSVYLLCTVLVGLFVLLQHVHYTIDVIAAPFFTYASYTIARVILVKHNDYD